MNEIEKDAGAQESGSKKKRGGGAKKKAVRKEGQRRMEAMTRDEGERLSLAVGPGDEKDYVVRGRRKTKDDKRPKLIVESYPTFDEASSRVDAIMEAAASKGWTKSEKSTSIDDLL